MLVFCSKFFIVLAALLVSVCEAAWSFPADYINTLPDSNSCRQLKDNTATDSPMFCGKLAAPWPADEDAARVPGLVDKLAEIIYTKHKPVSRDSSFLIAALYTPKNRDIYWASVPKGNYRISGLTDPDIKDLNLQKGEFHAEHNAYLIALQPPNNAEPGRGSYMGTYGRGEWGTIIKPCSTKANNCAAFLRSKQISFWRNTEEFMEANRGRTAVPDKTAGPSDRSRSPG